MITWAQLGGLMPTGLGTVGGLLGSFNLAEFGGFGMVVGALVGFVVGLVVKSRARHP